MVWLFFGRISGKIKSPGTVMEPTLYYIFSTLAAAACLAVKYVFRPSLGSKGYVVLVAICFLILCWQFTLFANGNAMFIAGSETWAKANWPLRNCALGFALAHAFATFEASKRKKKDKLS
ncbi:hypothetical protein ACF0H2_10430 [Serratia marcescens]|jgi:hypothetical protein